MKSFEEETGMTREEITRAQQCPDECVVCQGFTTGGTYGNRYGGYGGVTSDDWLPMCLACYEKGDAKKFFLQKRRRTQ